MAIGHPWIPPQGDDLPRVDDVFDVHRESLRSTHHNRRRSDEGRRLQVVSAQEERRRRSAARPGGQESPPGQKGTKKGHGG